MGYQKPVIFVSGSGDSSAAAAGIGPAQQQLHSPLHASVVRLSGMQP